MNRFSGDGRGSGGHLAAALWRGAGARGGGRGGRGGPGGRGFAGGCRCVRSI